MKITLYSAISVDGFIANDKDETPWSDEEWVLFSNFLKSQDAIILGRNTYNIMIANEEFVEGPKYFVATTHGLQNDKYKPIIIRSKEDIPNYEKIGVIGGSTLNASIAKLGLIDELILDIEPLTLGSGKKLFNDEVIEFNLQLKSTKRYGENSIQCLYSIK